MVPVTLYRIDGEFAVLPSAELDSAEVETLVEYDPFDFGPAH